MSQHINDGNPSSNFNSPNQNQGLKEDTDTTSILLEDGSRIMLSGDNERGRVKYFDLKEGNVLPKEGASNQGVQLRRMEEGEFLKHSDDEFAGESSQDDLSEIANSGIVIMSSESSMSSENCAVDKCLPDWLITDYNTHQCNKQPKSTGKMYYGSDFDSYAPQCNSYCEWTKRENQMHGPVYDNIESALSLRELGEKYQSVFGQIKCVLIDLSGTIHVGKTYIEGGREAIELLREFGISYRFCTNTTKESKNTLLKKLKGFGFTVEPHEICTSLTAARDFIDKNELRPLFLIEKDAMEDFEGVSEENPNSVCIGLSPTNFNYLMLNKALRLIRLGAPWVGIHQGKYFEDSDGNLSLGPGPFIQSLRFATGTQPIIVGKPERRFFREVIKPFDCELTETVMIGDDVGDDVGGAIRHGMKGILVRTGKFREGDERKIHPLKPDMLTSNLYTAVRAVVGSICLENGIQITAESSYEDITNESTILREAAPNTDLLKRIQDHFALDECPRALHGCTVEKTLGQPRPPQRQIKDFAAADEDF